MMFDLNCLLCFIFVCRGQGEKSFIAYPLILIKIFQFLSLPLTYTQTHIHTHGERERETERERESNDKEANNKRATVHLLTCVCETITMLTNTYTHSGTRLA